MSETTLAEPAAPEQVDCTVCGAPAPRMFFKHATDIVYGICPPTETVACIERAKARDAEAAAESESDPA